MIFHNIKIIFYDRGDVVNLETLDIGIGTDVDI